MSSILHFPVHIIHGQNRSLYRSAIRNRLIWIDIGARRTPTKIFPNHAPYFGDARRASHQHHIINLALTDAGIAQHFLNRLQTRHKQVVA
mmetsp:Transcript_4837/g.8020  ORF Transcript_4837/g.8020 Transcript_4837/m.8020 type:complete len:90 (-) Transcript_4837:521-790(-)